MIKQTGIIRANARVLSMSNFMESMRDLGFNINIHQNRDNTCSIHFYTDEIFLKIDMGGDFTVCKSVLTAPVVGGPDKELLSKMVHVENLATELLLEVNKHMIALS